MYGFGLPTLVVPKLVLCVPGFAWVVGEPGSSRSQNLLEGAMKQMLVQRCSLRLLDEAGGPLHHHPGQEKQNSPTSRISTQGVFSDSEVSYRA